MWRPAIPAALPDPQGTASRPGYKRLFCKEVVADCETELGEKSLVQVEALVALFLKQAGPHGVVDVWMPPLVRAPAGQVAR